MPSKEFLNKLRKNAFKSVDVKDFVSKKEFQGYSPPSVFIGSYGYPKVYGGILNSPVGKEVEVLEDYGFLAENFSNQEVKALRTGLVNSRSVIDVRKGGKIEDYLKGVGIAKNSVEVETKFKRFRAVWNIDKDVSLFGYSYDVEKMKVYDDYKVDRKVQKVVDDVDFKAVDSMAYLYDKGISENKISEILSTAQLGLGDKRKFVPTKWSITAVDDSLGKKIIEEIKDYDLIEDVRIFEGDLYGNYFKVIIFPKKWGFELLEIEIREKKLRKHNKEGYLLYNDYEDYFGRKDYAKETVGGYYATRLGVLEYLRNIKKQGYVLVLREIRDYDMPMGVWVVREGVRKSMRNRNKVLEDRLKDSSKNDVEKYFAFLRYFIKFSYSGIDLDTIIRKLKTTRVLKQRDLFWFS